MVFKLFAILAFLVLGLFVIVQTLNLWDARGINAHMRAETGLVRDAALRGCITYDAIQTEALDRGWRINDGSEFYTPETPLWDSRIWVEVSPPMPFAKLPGRTYLFDADGCLIR